MTIQVTGNGTQLKIPLLTGRQASLKRGYASASLAAGDWTPSATEQESEGLEVTGVLTANRVVNVPAAAAGQYYRIDFYNNTTGAFTVTVKVSGQTGVVVGQTKRAVLLVDTVDVRRLTADV